MKSMRTLFGMLVCLFFVTSHAQASVVELNFEESNALSLYSTNYGVTFTGWQGIAETFDPIDKELYGFKFLKFGSNTSIQFDTATNLYSFDYVVSGSVNYEAGSSSGSLVNNFGTINFDVAKQGLLSLVTFTINDGSTFFIDNIKIAAPVPVPAAALLLGAGLLGIVGVRRRQLS